MDNARGERAQAIMLLKDNKKGLSRAHYRALLGMIDSGDIDGAKSELRRLLLGGGSNAIELHR